MKDRDCCCFLPVESLISGSECNVPFVFCFRPVLKQLMFRLVIANPGKLGVTFYLK